jgi:1-acyl-sn-glycerol-3-phosphate acyltransferase
VIREGNYTSFPGLYGFFMRNCNTLPLSSNLSVMKEFLKSVDVLLKDGHFILVYPEQAMWWNYRKPRPTKSGAFKFAVKNNVPVLPCFITMRDSNVLGEDGFYVQEYTVHVYTPIYPKNELSEKENIEYLKMQNDKAWKELYEKTYMVSLGGVK